MQELEEKQKYSRSSLWRGNLDVGERGTLPLENSHTGKFSQSRQSLF